MLPEACFLGLLDFFFAGEVCALPDSAPREARGSAPGPLPHMFHIVSGVLKSQKVDVIQEQVSLPKESTACSTEFVPPTQPDLSPAAQHQYSSPTVQQQQSQLMNQSQTSPNLSSPRFANNSEQGFVNNTLTRNHQNSPIMQQKPSPPVQSPVALPVQHR